MKLRTIAVLGTVLGAALAFAPDALAAGQNTSHGNSSAQIPVPQAKPAAAPEPQPAPETRPAERARPTQQAGVAKPIKVYWFLSGR